MTYMLKRIRAIGLVTACLAGSAAMAADVDGGIFTDDANFARPAELGSGWYIRGDIGINFDGHHDVSISGNPVESTYLDNNFTDKTHFSIGAGYRFNGFLRMDAGLGRLAGTDYSSSQLMYEDGTEPLGTPAELIVLPGDPNPCNGWGTFIDTVTDVEYIDDDFITNCINKDTVEYDVTYGMVNAYADLGNFYGFMPFVGAGIGVGRVSWREELDSVECVPQSEDVRVEGCRAYGVADQPAANQPYTQPGTVSNGVDYRLGWAVTAGLAYEVTEAVVVEAAYRYMNFGGPSLSSSATTGSSLSATGYGTHQVNLGMRYNIW
ncbi:outer membrane protein [Oricola sp.]|uniref:outer membrane protein n=1 Tax=Oricola sp. TaxID=1979950 RepID=UPI003BAC8302